MTTDVQSVLVCFVHPDYWAVKCNMAINSNSPGCIFHLYSRVLHAQGRYRTTYPWPGHYRRADLIGEHELEEVVVFGFIILDAEGHLGLDPFPVTNWKRSCD